MNYKKYCMLFCLLILLPVLLVGQESILRLEPYTVNSKYLNAQIVADTTANGKLQNRVYELQRGALYLANASFANAGFPIRMRANDSINTSTGKPYNKPVIMLYPTGTGANPQNPPGNLFSVQADVSLRNIIISGYYELVDTNLNNLQGALLNIPATATGASIIIDSCVLTNSNGNHVRTDGAPKVIKITNSVFANMGFLGRSNLGGGKAVDVRDVSVDSLIMVNNTFVNWQDRIVRHYPLTVATGPIKYFLFDHNTLVNGQSYHGLLSLGGMGKVATITNNLFIDPFTLGNDTDAVRQTEFVPSNEKDPYGKARMNWIFSVPNDTTKWVIKNNFYAISDSGQAFYNRYASAGVTGEGAPLTWHLNSKIGADSTNAFKKVTLALTKIPLVMNKANDWYRDPNGGNKTKNTPTTKWNLSFDYDRKGYRWLRDTLNCTYSTSSTVYTGGTFGYPAGDLNWFPTKLAAWLKDPAAQSVKSISDVVPNEYALGQNYPNPFNPSTVITYQLAAAGMVTLKVYNVIGQEVTTLVNSVQSAGTYEAEFNASKLSSGIYFYSLHAGNFAQTKKMMLVK